MRVLLFDDTPAYFFPGGKQVYAERLHESLRAIRVEVEFARWWDPGQKCDVIHMLGYPPGMVHAAHEAGAKVVLTHIVDGMTNASPARRLRHRVRNSILRRCCPGVARRLFTWHVLPEIDALVYIHSEDEATARELYGVPPEKTHVIPHGCTPEQVGAIHSGPRHKQSYLVSIGSIVRRKNPVVLARAALQAKVPVVFMGKPFSDQDEYYREFLGLVDGRYVVHRGFVSEQEKMELIAGASGFALLSNGESGCIAVYEAAAAGLPLLLSDLPWARGYGRYETITRVHLGRADEVADGLARFYASSARRAMPVFPVMTWAEVAAAYLRVYEQALGWRP